MAKNKQKKKKAKKVSYHKQSEELTLRQWQVALRKQYGQNQTFELKNEDEHPVWSDFQLHNAERNSNYRVAIRGQEPGDNFCSCMDFKVSGLGTCKHIEWTLHKLFHTHGNKQHFKKPIPRRTYTSVYLYYGEKRSLRIRIGDESAEAYEELAGVYFDEEGVFYEHTYLDFEKFLAKAQQLSDRFRCYPDALEWVIQRRADERRAKHQQRLAAQVDSLDGLVKAKFYPYQREGVLFAFGAGRSLIADEMGLGKTIQAIAVAELYRREYGIGSVFIICPTSLKYQWRAEIQRFTDSSVHVVEGPQHKRIEQYASREHFYKILTYNIVARDVIHLNAADPDLIVLDEAQRIKNWETQIARAVKRLSAPYRLALTGTPLENKLEDLYSIMQFLDQFLLGPLYQLLARHQAKDEYGIIHGYRHLDELFHKLKGVMLRRRKKEVLQQLPPRLDKNLLVPMTGPQWVMHQSYEADVAQLVAKWRRHNFLSEKDRLRLMACLQSMRMSCNSTYIVDLKNRHDTKIDELFYLLEERLAQDGESVVVFSQWSRMTHLVAKELEERGIRFVHLHGGVPSTKRGDLLDQFRDDDSCRVFLSTDAGGVGLNLQKASLVINLDLPWNPAVLEQRIGRVYRLGQERPVQVTNLISEGTIEHRMIFRLKFKSALAEAVLDTAQEHVFMSDSKFKDFMENLETVTETSVGNEVPVEATPATDSDRDLERVPTAAKEEGQQGQEDYLDEWWEEGETETATAPATTAEQQTIAQSTLAPDSNRQTTTADQAVGSPAEAQQLMSQGLNFLSRLNQTLRDEQATKTLVNSLMDKDKTTGKTYLKIPVENEAVVSNALQLLGSLLGKMG